MSGCGISNGISITCENLKKVGGVNKRVFAADVDDIESYTFDGSGYVTAINFATYGGLREITGTKKSHTFGSQLSKQQPGGTTFYLHDLTLKLFPDNPEEDSVVEEMGVADLVFVVQDNNEEFFILGGTNGMEQIEGVQNSGAESASDVSENLTFQGDEKTKPLRFLDTDFATSKATLEGYVI